ncbi:MAG: hypothetical protein H6625_06640 [Bdellovibrionaceae bacterium]|nr:hypothetical protein [Pseudobdellovibrionaceae bacterium]
MRSILLVVFTTLYFSGEMAFAYASDLYGHGILPGAQDCGYGTSASKVHYDKDFEYRESNRELKEATKELQRKSRDLIDLKRDLKDHKSDAERFLKPFAAQQVIAHVEDQKSADHYRGGVDGNYAPACSGNNRENVSGEFCREDQSCDGASPENAQMQRCHKEGDKYVGKRDDWIKYVDNYSSGYMSLAICSDYPTKTGKSQERCKKWLNDYMKDRDQLARTQAEVDLLKDRIKDLKRDIKRRKQGIKREIEDGTFVESEDESTEADNCATCNWFTKNAETIKLVAGVGVPILNSYLGYTAAKSISEQNARLGWPTSPYLAAGFSYPFIMQGIYGGVMGGMAAGGIGCSGGYYGGAMGPNGMMGPGGLFGNGTYGGMGGAFGYPPYLYGGGPWGGGPYMPGMGPWGIPGPYIGGGFPIGGMLGGMMGGYPMGGGMMGGYPMGGGMMGGYPMGGMMGGMIGGAMGYPMGGMIGGAMGGMMGGYPMGGMIGGAMGGMMGGYPMGGMMGGYPMGGMMGGYPMGGMMGGPMGGMMGGPMGGMMGGYPMGGMMGMPPFNNMMGGYPMGAMMGGAMGGPMGGAMGGALGGINMQQQYMNQYMQMLQQQMQVQQEQAQKQQVIGRLTQELFKIQMQIQQISTGSYYGGSTPYSVSPTYGPPRSSGPTATTPNSSSGGSPIRSR